MTAQTTPKKTAQPATAKTVADGILKLLAKLPREEDCDRALQIVALARGQ